MSNTPPPVDATKDRVVYVGGACLFGLAETMVKMIDAAPAWVTLVPTEASDGEKATGAWPRERHVLVSHSMQVGTVDELTDEFRGKLVAAFDSLTGKRKDGEPAVVPFTGEASLRKQTEVLGRSGYDKPVGALPLVAADICEAREARRNELQKFTPSQNVFERDVLARLVATYAAHQLGTRTCSAVLPPSPAAVEGIKSLISALTALLWDNYRLEDIKYAEEKGITRETITDLRYRFRERNGGTGWPGKITLTEAQVKEAFEAFQFDAADLKAAPLPYKKILGMTVVVGPHGPVLE